VKHEFNSAVVVAIEVGDIVDCRTAGRTGGDQKFRSSLRPPRIGPNAALKDRLEYQWKVRAPTVPALVLTRSASASSGATSCARSLFYSPSPPSCWSWRR